MTTAVTGRGGRICGWREWVALPELGIPRIKAKLDTGARTSALHAWDPEVTSGDAGKRIRFSAYRRHGGEETVIRCEAPVTDRRWITNSGGGREQRYVIATTLALGSASWTIELTLADRTAMGFRMLLGREALRGRIVVDPSASFRTGRPPVAASTRSGKRRTARSRSAP